ncbi:hypothetical protein SAMN05445504_2395 [Burkholderia sp. CF099]|nr:hypothetical protein SAMN05445504_2395 [Burkholderia sp. CF099]
MNCKPGDLAFVVRDEHSVNIGRVVRVVGPARYIGASSVFGPAWYCVTEGEPLLVMQFDDPSTTFWLDEADIFDQCLRPISGVPVNDEISHEVTA